MGPTSHIGDGFFATFDGPARAIIVHSRSRSGCASSISRFASGVHTGEGELIDGKHGGISVAIGARISALAPASGVLVSQTVKDLVAGSGLTFKAAGEQELKGVPDRWQIYAVTSRPE